MENSKEEGVTKEVGELLFRLQPRCINCGSTNMIAAHHRIFRSEGNEVLKEWLEKMAGVFLHSRGRDLIIWESIHSIQNLCVLCQNCHTGNIKAVHGGNEKLRQVLKNSYTDPKTGFNIAYYKKTLPY